MADTSLLPLIPRNIEFRGKTFRILKDRHIRDTITIVVADTTGDFFLTLGTKRKSEANFFGDLSLVKDANVFMMLRQSVFVRNRQLSEDEARTFNNRGSYRLSITQPEEIVVDEDSINNISAYPAYEQFSDAMDDVLPAGRCHRDRRTYLIPENKVFPGGRSVAARLAWDEVGIGNGLLVDSQVVWEMYGIEYEPGS